MPGLALGLAGRVLRVDVDGREHRASCGSREPALAPRAS